MTDYMTITTELPPYFFFPWFLLDMGLTLTAKLTYALLLDRARLSQLNGWTDEAGRVYIIFPIEKIARNARQEHDHREERIGGIRGGGAD